MKRVWDEIKNATNTFEYCLMPVTKKWDIDHWNLMMSLQDFRMSKTITETKFPTEFSRHLSQYTHVAQISHPERTGKWYTDYRYFRVWCHDSEDVVD